LHKPLRCIKYATAKIIQNETEKISKVRLHQNLNKYKMAEGIKNKWYETCCKCQIEKCKFYENRTFFYK